MRYFGKYAQSVPRDPAKNVAFRLKIRQRAARHPSLQKDLWIAAARDPLFYCNVFAQTYNPKDHADHPNRPFILWDYQEEFLHDLLLAMGNHDFLAEKSRDMGTSWLCLIGIMWRWHFFQAQSFLLVSRIQELVDKPSSPDCLFWKLDWLLKYFPAWLKPSYRRLRNTLLNKELESTINGASTTEDTSAGGRRTAIMFDEFSRVPKGFEMLAASRDVTNTRIFNSTPQGTGNAFAERAEHMPAHHKRRVHWSLHPVKRIGLYQYVENQLRILDGKYRDGYPYILDGRLRSPWYDDQCSRAASDQEIAQELDIEYQRSGWQFFDQDLITKLFDKVRPPYARGDLAWIRVDSPEFMPSIEGPLKLWTALDQQGRPPESKYVIGVDVATGVASKTSSQSAASVLDKRTHEKVAEYTTNCLDPAEFAQLILALCWMFHNAYLIWEENGPGQQFGVKVVQAGYGPIYYRMNDGTGIKRQKCQPGFTTQKRSKRVLLGEYAVALRNGEFINRSIEALRELGEYVHMPNGDITHIKGHNQLDPTACGENHGDIVIADALAYHGSKAVSMEEWPQHEIIPSLCFATISGMLEPKITDLDTWPSTRLIDSLGSVSVNLYR